jgi:hypothetical protein
MRLAGLRCMAAPPLVANELSSSQELPSVEVAHLPGSRDAVLDVHPVDRAG